jgi:hypothetical protein
MEYLSDEPGTPCGIILMIFRVAITIDWTKNLSAHSHLTASLILIGEVAGQLMGNASNSDRPSTGFC